MPSWVSEGSVHKYNRAVKNLDAVNAARKAKGESELTVKELYADVYQGLVVEVPVEAEVVEAPKKGKK